MEGERPEEGQEQQAERGSFLDNLYGALFAPRRTFAALAAEPPLGQAIVLFVIVNVVSAAATNSRLLGSTADRGSLLAPPALFLALLASSFILWFLATAILHLLAEFMGGRGSGLTLFALLSFAEAPALLNGPIRLLRATPLTALAPVASLAVFLWTLWLTVEAVGAAHHLPLKRSLPAVGLPLIALVVLGILLVIAVGAVFTLPLFHGVPYLPRL